MFKYTHRKPDPLKLLAIAVTIAVLMTSAADAAEPFHEPLNLANLSDGDLMVTPLGRQGAGLHMSYRSHPVRVETERSTAVSYQPSNSNPSLFLSVRVPW